MDLHRQNNGNIRWNLTKFLVGREGRVVEHLDPTTPMGEVAARVESVL